MSDVRTDFIGIERLAVPGRRETRADAFSLAIGAVGRDDSVQNGDAASATSESRDHPRRSPTGRSLLVRVRKGGASGQTPAPSAPQTPLVADRGIFGLPGAMDLPPAARGRRKPPRPATEQDLEETQDCQPVARPIERMRLRPGAANENLPQRIIGRFGGRPFGFPCPAATLPGKDGLADPHEPNPVLAGLDLLEFSL